MRFVNVDYCFRVLNVCYNSVNPLTKDSIQTKICTQSIGFSTTRIFGRLIPLGAHYSLSSGKVYFMALCKEHCEP